MMNKATCNPRTSLLSSRRCQESRARRANPVRARRTRPPQEFVVGPTLVVPCGCPADFAGGCHERARGRGQGPPGFAPRSGLGRAEGPAVGGQAAEPTPGAAQTTAAAPPSVSAPGEPAELWPIRARRRRQPQTDLPAGYGCVAWCESRRHRTVVHSSLVSATIGTSTMR